MHGVCAGTAAEDDVAGATKHCNCLRGTQVLVAFLANEGVVAPAASHLVGVRAAVHRVVARIGAAFELGENVVAPVAEVSVVIGFAGQEVVALIAVELVPAGPGAHFAVDAYPPPKRLSRYRSASPIMSSIVSRSTLTAVSPRRLSSSVHR